MSEQEEKLVAGDWWWVRLDDGTEVVARAYSEPVSHPLGKYHIQWAVDGHPEHQEAIPISRCRRPPGLLGLSRRGDDDTLTMILPRPHLFKEPAGFIRRRDRPLVWVTGVLWRVEERRVWLGPNGLAVADDVGGIAKVTIKPTQDDVRCALLWLSLASR